MGRKRNTKQKEKRGRRNRRRGLHSQPGKIVTEDLEIYTGEITIGELEMVIKKLKRRKAPGPDNIQTEFIKELDDTNKLHLLTKLNEWWEGEIPEEMTKARVVLIHKKGDKENLANYRPISLLNTFYKLVAAIIQNRLAIKLDNHLQQTQYGFRRKRGTAEALQYVRRMVDKGESRQNKTLLVLLDWEKAFDKIHHDKLFLALDRMNVPEQITKLIKSMYNNPQFKVSMDGKESNWHTQHTGIRQGCPLSPYLFILVVTMISHDIHKDDGAKTRAQRIPGTDFDEVVYADDTICIAQTAAAMNRLLAAIETQGGRCVMKINKDKCEYLDLGANSNIHFANGTKVPIKTEVK